MAKEKEKTGVPTEVAEHEEKTAVAVEDPPSAPKEEASAGAEESPEAEVAEENPTKETETKTIVVFNRMDHGKLRSTSVVMELTEDTFEEGVRSIRRVIQSTLSGTTTGGRLDKTKIKTGIDDNLRVWPSQPTNPKLCRSTWKRPENIEDINLQLLCRHCPALRETMRVLMDLIYTICTENELSLDGKQYDKLWEDLGAHMAQLVRDSVESISVVYIPCDQEHMRPPKNNGYELIRKAVEIFFENKPQRTAALAFLATSGMGFIPEISKEKGEVFLRIVRQNKDEDEWPTTEFKQTICWMDAELKGLLGHTYSQ